MEKQCKCCGKTFPETNYYYSKNLAHYPDGYLDVCKDCLKKTVEPADLRTFLWVLKQCDVPFVPEDWYHLMQRYGNTSPSILSRYLSRMKLSDFKYMHWKETFVFLEEKANYLPQITKSKRGED